MSNLSAIETLNDLVEGQLLPLLQSLPKSTSVSDFLVRSAHKKFESKVAPLCTKAEETNLQSSIDQLILRIEHDLESVYEWGPFHTIVGLRKNTEHAYSYCSLENEPGYFISEQCAQKILKLHPPVALKETSEIGNPLQRLALTRHTEDTIWQKQYSNILSTLTHRDFETRCVEYAVYDSEALSSVLNLSGQRKKPWRISHSKETGIINCFTHPEHEKLPVPLLQHLLVLFHYFFETKSAGLYIKKQAHENGEEVGRYINQMIHSHESRFSFFHPNTYSEHIFWEKALALFLNQFRSANTEFFMDTIDCGARSADKNHIISLNIVDRVWDINLSQNQDSAAYFGTDPTRFTYHFKEALWYNALCQMTGLSTRQAEKLILENLHLGDKDLTTLLQHHHEHTKS